MNLIYYSEHKCCLEYKEQTALLCEICNEAYCTKCSNEHVNKEWAKSHTFIKIGNLKREDIFDKLNNTVIRCERIEEILIHPLIVANNFPFLSLDRKINEIFKNTKEIAKDHKFIISFIEEAKKIKKEEDVMKMKKLLNILENYANYFDLIGVISELRGSHLELNDLIVEKQNELTVVNFLLNDTLNKIAIHKILLKKIKDYVCQWNKQFEDILNSFNKSFTALYKQSKCCFKKEFDQVINMINEQKIVCKELDLKKEKAKKTLMDLDEKIKEAKEELRELEEQNTIIDYDMQVKDDELKEIINKTEELRNEYEELYLKNSMDRIHYEALSENLNELKEEVRVKEEEYIKVKERVRKINDEKEKLEPMENKIETIKLSLINILLMKGTLKEVENKIEILEERKKKAEEDLSLIKKEYKSFKSSNNKKMEKWKERKEGKVYNQESEIKKAEANEEDLGIELEKIQDNYKNLQGKTKNLNNNIEKQDIGIVEGQKIENQQSLDYVIIPDYFCYGPNIFMWISNRETVDSYKDETFVFNNAELKKRTMKEVLSQYMDTKYIALGFLGLNLTKDKSLDPYTQLSFNLSVLDLLRCNLNFSFIESLLKLVQKSKLRCLMIDHAKLEDKIDVDKLIKLVSKTRIQHFSAQRVPLNGFLKEYYNSKNRSIKYLNIFYLLEKEDTSLSESELWKIADTYDVKRISLVCKWPKGDNQIIVGEKPHKCLTKP